MQTDRLQIRSSNSPKLNCIPVLDLAFHLPSQKGGRSTTGGLKSVVSSGSNPIVGFRSEKYSSFTPKVNQYANYSKQNTIEVSQLTGAQLLKILKPNPCSKKEPELSGKSNKIEPGKKTRSHSKAKKSSTRENGVRLMLSDKLGEYNLTKLKNTRDLRKKGVLSKSPEKRQMINSYSSVLIKQHSPFLNGAYEAGSHPIKAPGKDPIKLVQNNSRVSMREGQSEAGSSLKAELILSSADTKKTPTHLVLSHRCESLFSSHSARKILAVKQNFQNHDSTPRPIRSEAVNLSSKKNTVNVHKMKQDGKPLFSLQTRPQVLDLKHRLNTGISSGHVIDELGYMQSFTERIMQRAKRVTNLL